MEGKIIEAGLAGKNMLKNELDSKAKNQQTSNDTTPRVHFVESHNRISRGNFVKDAKLVSNNREPKSFEAKEPIWLVF